MRKARARLAKGRALVAVMIANNETGVIQPLPEVACLVKESATLLLVDAVQAAGKIPVGFDEIDADYLSLSAHKLGGPQGTGALIVREGAPFSTFIAGGGQERGRRAGTENVYGIAGFGAVAHVAGALGKPTWALLAWHTDYRWPVEHETTPWYPQVRIFRQKRVGEWDPVLAEARDALAAFARGGPAFR